MPRRAGDHPAMADPLPAFARLLEVIARLRAPDGCPWDRQQTLASMAPCLLEEAYEAVDALRGDERAAQCEELGDVLMNVLMCAQIASESDRENGGFDAAAVALGVADKLVRRHPHVFGDRRADSADEAYRNWERRKLAERTADAAGGAGAAAKGVLAGVPQDLPALLRAFRIGEKAARVGFDWPDPRGPREKIAEELRELDEAIARGDPGAVAAELGDLLFSVCNLARHLQANPEMALRGTVDRFVARFAKVERELGADLTGRSLDELEAAWQRAKADEERRRADAADDGGPTAGPGPA